jgi:hypothetical protein
LAASSSSSTLQHVRRHQPSDDGYATRVLDRFLQADSPGMLEQEQGGRTIVRYVVCCLLNIFWGEQAQKITGQGSKLLGFLTAQITQFHRHGVALFIFLEKEQIDHPDNAFLSRSA